MRLMRFEYDIVLVPGKDLVIADTLSRAPLPMDRDERDAELEKEAETHINVVVNSLLATDVILLKYLHAQQHDEICKEASHHTLNGWPDHRLKGGIARYQQVCSELSVSPGGLLLNGERIVVPTRLQGKCLKCIHDSHQGISKCRERAKRAVWWPGISRDIENFISRCNTCATHRDNRAEPLLPTALRERPWQRVASDIYSKFIEFAKLPDLSSSAIIDSLKPVIGRFVSRKKL